MALEDLGAYELKCALEYEWLVLQKHQAALDMLSLVPGPDKQIKADMDVTEKALYQIEQEMIARQLVNPQLYDVDKILFDFGIYRRINKLSKYPTRYE